VRAEIDPNFVADSFTESGFYWAMEHLHLNTVTGPLSQNIVA